MGKTGLEECLLKMNKFDIKVRSLVTDRHAQIRKFMRESQPDILHFFDEWHFS